MTLRPILAAALLALFAAAGTPAFAAEGSTKSAAAPQHYLQFPGVTASVMGAGGRRGVLAMDASLDIPDDALRSRATSLTPRLRAAYAQSLNIYAGSLSPGRPVDPDYVSLEMQRQTNAVIGKSGAKFLIGSILVN
jgi:hypothetical protein